MSDDKKDVLDGIDLSFDDDFDKEVEASLSEKTAMESSGDAGGDEIDLDISAESTADKTELHQSGHDKARDSVSQHTEAEIGGHDAHALEDKSLEIGGQASIDSIELGDMIIDSEDTHAKTEAFGGQEGNHDNANIKELFADVSEDLTGGATESLSDHDIESATESVDSEEIEIGAANVQETTKVRDTGPRKKETEISKENTLEPETSKSAKKKKTKRRKKGGLTSDVLLKAAVVMVLLLGGAVYMVFFTDQGLLGFSLKKSEAKSRLEQAAEEASNLTPELLQELDQKYTQANKLLAMDSYDFYEKAKTIYKEILDAFSNHPKASSGLAEATMMAGRGYLDTEDFNQVQQWVRQADTVSPNTPETLRAQIRFLQFQGRSDEAKARLTQLLKIEENNIDNLMVAAELSLIIEDFEATQTYLTKLMELDPNRIRAHYIQASLTQAQGKVVEAVKMYQALMESNQHIPSTVAYYQYLHAKNDQTILEPLNKIVAEQKSKMGPKMYAACYKMISEIFAAQGNEEKSIITLELAVEKMSRNDVYAYELGLKHEHLKAYEKSVKYFEQAYTIKPDHHEYTVAYGRNLRFVGKSKEAEALLKKVVTAAPEMESAIVQYAESRADQGFYAEVTTYLQEVLTKTPGFVDVQNLLAMLYLEQNEFKEAAKILNDAIKNAKTDIQKATVHRSLGILALKQEKYDLALKHLTTSNKLQPNNASTLGALGKTYYYKQEYQESEKYIIDSLNIDQLNYEARGILAQIYFDKGKPGEAKKVINEILEDDPKNVSLRVTLGKMLIEEGQYIEAIDHLDEAYLYDSENYETYYYLGIAERESGKVDISLNSFTKAIEIWSESHNAYYQRGLTFIRKNDIKNASLDMEKANQLKPDWTLPNKAIAKYYYEINNFDKAGEQFKAIVDVNAKDEEALYYLGKSYFYQEKTSEALKQFNALLKLSPNDGRAHYEIGVIYEDAGDFQQALKFLSNAKAKNPKNPSVYYHLGFVLKNLDQPKQAVVAFQTYLQLDPKTIERAEIEDEIYRLTYHH